MKFNMDLVRDILFWCENNLPSRNLYLSSHIDIPSYSPEEITFHFKLLIDSGYIIAANAGRAFSDDPFARFPQHLTMDGYQFLESIKNDTVWNGMKEEAGKIGIQAIKLAIPILTELVAKKLMGL